MTIDKALGTGLALLLSLAGCIAETGGATGTITFEDMPTTPAEKAAPPSFLALDESGGIVLAGGASGAIESRTASGPGSVLDLAWDPWLLRAVSIEAGEDEGGEIAGYPLKEGALGERTHLAWLDGRARILPTPFGPVLFEESYGTRWRLLGAKPTASVIAPPPASAWIERREGGAVIRALVLGDQPAIRAASVSDDGIAEPSEQPLGFALSESARLAPTSTGALLVDIDGEHIVARAVDGGSIGPAIAALPAAPGARIEAALRLGGDRVALLVSGSNEVVVLTTGDDGAISGAARIALPGAVRRAEQGPSNALIALGPDRLLAATDAGVTAVDVSIEEPPILAIDTAFVGDSRCGPLAAVIPP